jgi:hypothetical protein
MNTTITLAVTTLAITLLSSCQSETEKLQQTAINEVKETLLDPKSFELIETKVDTIYASTKMLTDYSFLTDIAMEWTKEANKVIDDISWEHRFGRPAGKSMFNRAQQYLDSSKSCTDRYAVIIEKSEALKDTPNDSIVGYTVDIRYYATSRGGEKRMGENRYFQYNNGKTKLEDVSPLKDLSSL